MSARSKVRWIPLTIATLAGVAVISLLNWHPQLALSVAACLLVGGIASGTTYMYVLREVDPVQVRFGSSTIRIGLDSSMVDDATRHQIVSRIAEYALECLRSGKAPAWRPTTSPVGVERPIPNRILETEDEAGTILDLPEVQPTNAPQPLCHSCKQPADGPSIHGNPTCRKCFRILNRQNGELQTAAHVATD